MGSVTELEHELAMLRREVEALRDETAALSQARSPGAPSPSPTTSTPESDRAPDVDRRALLRLVGGTAAAAGAVAATTALGSAPAAAADFDPLYLAANNSSVGFTLLRDAAASPKSFHILYVTDNATVPASGYPAAVGGYAVNNTVINGVYGATTNANGHGVVGQVHGLSQGTGAAVRGIGGFAAVGVWGTGPTGVYGQGSGPGSAGVLAEGEIGVEASGNRANMHLTSSGTAASNRTNGVLGDLVCDGAGELWFCVAPGTWRRISGAATAGALVVLSTTLRIYDSRVGELPTTVQKGQLTAGVPRTINAVVSASVPSGIRAAMVNVTVANTGPAGFVSLYRNGIAWPGTSTLNWNGPGQSVANMAVVSVDSLGRFAAYANSRTDLVIDLLGYYK